MRVALSLVALTLTAGVTAAEPAPAPGSVAIMPDAQFVQPEGRIPCRDTIHAVRDERGLPRIQRETAAPEEPVIIAAVDHRINGCSVMVMYDNTSDVRPLPALPDGTGRLQRLQGR